MKNLFFLVALLSLATLAQAQVPGSGGPVSQPATAVPLDGGASLLLAGGGAYGLRHLRQRAGSKK